MRRTSRISFVAALVAAFAMLMANFAYADDIYNDLGASIDATLETMSLTVGGSNGQTTLSIDPTGSGPNPADGKSGCNFQQDTTLVTSVSSSNTAVATVSPPSITWGSCGDTQVVTVVPVATGSATIALAETSNTTGTSFNLAPAKFTVNVAAGTPPKQNQTITFAVPSSPQQYGESFDVNPTASSGLPVTLTPTGPCSTVPATTGYTVTMTSGSGVCELTASQGGNASYNPAVNVAHTVLAAKRTASVTPDASGKAYSAADPELTGTLSGFLTSDGVTATYSREPGESVLGGPYEITASLSPVANLSNYDITYNTADFTITRAPTTTTVSCTGAPFAYTGTALTPCTAAATGPDGFSQGLTVVYEDNRDAGEATASATFAGNDNYAGSSDSKNFTIDKAPSTVTVTCPDNVTYNGSAQQPCTATATGPGDFSQDLTPTYSNNINAGTATANATFAGNDNLLGNSNSDTFTIDKAPSTVTVTCDNLPVPTYNGSAHETCAATATGPGDFSESLNVTYLNNVNAGQATASASFDGNDNLLGSNNSANFTIAKAATTTVVTCGGGPFIFNGSAFTPCSASVTGPADLEDAVTVVYVSNTYPGTATATATYGGSDNYLSSEGSQTFQIQAWTLKGFYSPVDMNNTLNGAKSGSTVPLKFEVFAGTTELTSTSVVDTFKVSEITCVTLDTLSTDDIENYTTGGTSLRYDTTGGQFIQNWQTPRNKAGACYKVVLTTDDGSSKTAFFKLK